MKVLITDRIRTVITLTFVLLIIISMVVINVQAKKQDFIFEESYVNYHLALNFMSEQKVDDAEPILRGLVEEHGENASVVYNYALLQAIKGDFKTSAQYFQKAQDLRIAFLENPTFLAQYGEVLLRIEEFEKAKAYLIESQNRNKKGSLRYNENLADAVSRMLEGINN